MNKDVSLFLCKICLISAGIIFHATVAPHLAEAAVSIEVTGLRGGSTIDLGEIDIRRHTTHEELAVGISSTSAVQYKLDQVVSNPLINERGASLDASRIILEIIGGNSGIVRISQGAAMIDGTQELFISNANGQSENLTIIYSISAEDLPQSGTYTGAITFTLYTVDGSSATTKTVPVRLYVGAGLSFSMSDDSRERISFGTLNPGGGSEEERLSLIIRNNMPGRMHIGQEIGSPISNEQGDVLPISAISVNGSFAGSPIALEKLKNQMRFSSDDSSFPGVSTVELMYSVMVPDGQPAGHYAGVLRFRLEGSSGMSEADELLVAVDLEVLPVLSVAIRPSEGERLELAFGSLIPGQTSDPKSLIFNVSANTKKPYEIFHELSHLLISDEGVQLSENALICTGYDAVRGRLQNIQGIPITRSRSVVYASDQSGSPDGFVISCRVHIPKDAVAGTYNSVIFFTITER